MTAIERASKERTMKVRYIGPSTTGVDVIHPDHETPGANTVTLCEPGVDVDLPDGIALEQMSAGVFEPANAAASKALARYKTDAPVGDSPADITSEPDQGESTEES